MPLNFPILDFVVSYLKIVPRQDVLGTNKVTGTCSPFVSNRFKPFYTFRPRHVVFYSNIKIHCVFYIFHI